MTSILSFVITSFSRQSRAINVPVRPIPALKQIIQLYHFIYLFLFHKSYIFLNFFQFFFQNRSPAVDNDWSFFRPDVVDDNIPEFQQRVNIFRNTTVRPGCEVKLGHPFFLVSLKCRYILNHLSTSTYVMHTTFTPLFIGAVIATHRVGQSGQRQLRRCQQTFRHSKETHSRFNILCSKANKSWSFYLFNDESSDNVLFKHVLHF